MSRSTQIAGVMPCTAKHTHTRCAQRREVGAAHLPCARFGLVMLNEEVKDRFEVDRLMGEEFDCEGPIPGGSEQQRGSVGSTRKERHANAEDTPGGSQEDAQ